MNMREPSDLVIIGRIAGDISPLPMEKSGDIITDIISNLMEMTRCCFRMYVSCIVHLNKQEGIEPKTFSMLMMILRQKNLPKVL